MTWKQSNLRAPLVVLKACLYYVGVNIIPHAPLIGLYS